MLTRFATWKSLGPSTKAHYDCISAPAHKHSRLLSNTHTTLNPSSSFFQNPKTHTLNPKTPFEGFVHRERERKSGELKKMDKSMLGDLSSVPEEDKLRMSAMIDQLQIRDSLRIYNSLVERCFNDCVNTFYRKTLGKQEETCVRRCAEKFLKHSMRVGVRFAGLNQGEGAATTDKTS